MRQQLLKTLMPLGGQGAGLLPSLAAGASFSRGFHDNALGALSAGSSDKQEQQAGPLPAVSATPRLLQLAGMVNPGPRMPLSFAASGAASSSGPSMLASRRRSLPLLPGMGSSPAPAAQQARSMSYYTEGEIFGTTFMYTTNMMFWAGIVGAVAFRRNLIILLLSAETVMLACNMNFLFTAAYLNDITGAIMSITITTIAACETAIGLALCVAYFHMRSATDVEALNLLK